MSVVPSVKKRPAKIFHSLTSFVDSLRVLPDTGLTSRQDDWAGASLKDAFKLATQGWPEGTRKASEQAMKLASRIAEASAAFTVPVVEYDVIGCGFDAGAVALGVPEAWGVIQPQETKRSIHIVSNIVASGGVPASALMKRGMAVAALALAFQTAGYPVTVDVTQGADPARGEDGLVRVADASTGSQLDIDRIVFALAHPAMLRRLFRSFTDQQLNVADCTGKWDRSRVDSDSKPETDHPIDIFIGGVHLHEADRWRDGGEAWVLKEYLKQTT